MEPFSALGLLSSILALVGVAAKITCALDTLKQKWDEATLKIISLRTQVETFRSAFHELYEWMNGKSWQTSHSLEFIRKLSDSIEGCARLLCALEIKVSALSKDPDRPSRKSKMMVLWTASGVKEVSDSLQCQATALILLLQWYAMTDHSYSACPSSVPLSLSWHDPNNRCMAESEQWCQMMAKTYSIQRTTGP